MADITGQELNSYLLRERIGAGGFGREAGRVATNWTNLDRQL
jgi:hypothetical protein